jgi:hypothetical protein
MFAVVPAVGAMLQAKNFAAAITSKGQKVSLSTSRARAMIANGHEIRVLCVRHVPDLTDLPVERNRNATPTTPRCRGVLKSLFLISANPDANVCGVFDVAMATRNPSMRHESSRPPAMVATLDRSTKAERFDADSPDAHSNMLYRCRLYLVIHTCWHAMAASVLLARTALRLHLHFTFQSCIRFVSE